MCGPFLFGLELAGNLRDLPGPDEPPPIPYHLPRTLTCCMRPRTTASCRAYIEAGRPDGVYGFAKREEPIYQEGARPNSSYVFKGPASACPPRSPPTPRRQSAVNRLQTTGHATLLPMLPCPDPGPSPGRPGLRQAAGRPQDVLFLWCWSR
jgi:hypothetical protein